MKRFFAAGLAALLACSLCVPAYAADGTAQTADAVSLSFDSLEQTVRENNVSIKAYNSTVRSEEETDVTESYVSSFVSLTNQIEAYEAQIKELKKSISALGEGDAALKKTLQAQLATLENSLNAAYGSLGDLDDDEDDAKETHANNVVSTRREMQNAADQICLDAQNNYIALETLQYSINQAERSLAQLDRNIAAAQKQSALGLVGSNDLSSLKSQRETLLASRKAMNTQYENLSNTLAIQCGYRTGTTIRIAALPSVTAEQLSALNYETDLAAALENSYLVWSKDDAVRQAADDYKNDVTNTTHAQEAAKIQRDAEKENVTASFRKLYKDVQEKQAALTAANADLAQAQKTFNVQNIKFKRGMISRMAYTDAQDTLLTAQETASAAQIDLLTSYNTYQWAKRGVMESSAS